MTSPDRGLPPTDTQPEGPRSSASKGRTKDKDKHHLPLWQETILLLAVALVLAIAIKALFLQAFYIPSESMEPGLVKDDRILVQKVSYWGGGEPQRGDVVVFKDPGGWLDAAASAGPTGTVKKAMAKIGLYPSGGHLVKRVIGVEGDVIECCDDQGRIMVNGQPLDEDSYVQEQGLKCNGPMPTSGACDVDWKAGPVPEGRIFVMGDNRGHSADSSQHMCRPAKETDCVPGEEFVPVDNVVGRVFVLLWPRERFDWLSRPDTFEDIPDE